MAGPQLDSLAGSMTRGGRIVLCSRLNDSYAEIPIVPMMEPALLCSATVVAADAFRYGASKRRV